MRHKHPRDRKAHDEGVSIAELLEGLGLLYIGLLCLGLALISLQSADGLAVPFPELVLMPNSALLPASRP